MTKATLKDAMKWWENLSPFVRNLTIVILYFRELKSKPKASHDKEDR